MPGCALLAGLGAMQLGIGKLVIGTTKNTQAFIGNTLPEATYRLDALKRCAEDELLDDIAAVAISPGLTDRLLIKRALEHLWNTDLPLILDAGALIPGVFKPRKVQVIITPHPGEFSWLTGYSIEDSQKKSSGTCRAIRNITSSYCCFERYVYSNRLPGWNRIRKQFGE